MFRQLVLARIIEPVSKLDSVRVLEEAGIAAVSYATLRRRLPAYAKEPWRRKLSAACAAHARLGPASLLPDEGAAARSRADCSPPSAQGAMTASSSADKAMSTARQPRSNSI